MSKSVDYDQLAEQYRNYRKPDPRIAASIQAHIHSRQRILNVGAGMGAYEPPDCEVVAVEPSYEMMAQRKTSRAALVQGIAEYLPFADQTFDVSMGILTMHHWSDVDLGLREMQRVTQDKIILFTWVGYGNDFWLEDYIPEFRGIDAKLFPTLKALGEILGNISVDVVEIPHDCTDGFMCAYWRRPKAYLDANVRSAISTFSRISNVQGGLAGLQADIDSGVWHERYGYLNDRQSLDLGYRLVVCDLAKH